MGRGFNEYLMPESARREGVAFSAFIDYRLPDGTKLPVLQQAAWCPNCQAFALAEDVPSIESLEAEIRGLEASDPNLLQKWAFVSNGAPIENRMAELRKRVEWRWARRSPPRCLPCGSVGVTPVPDSAEFAHPQTGERVVVGFTGFVDMDPWAAEFSPEGEKL